jgi:hypothetical protein
MFTKLGLSWADGVISNDKFSSIKAVGLDDHLSGGDNISAGNLVAGDYICDFCVRLRIKI